MRGEGSAAEAASLILLAEDDGEMRRLVAQKLRTDGHCLIECSDGYALLHFIDSRIASGDSVGVDLIISDIRMPGLTGLEVLERLRQRDPSTPVIMMTAFGDFDTRLQAERFRVAAFLDKPFDLDQLRRIVRLIVSAES